MTGIWLGGAFLAGAAYGWRMAALVCGLVVALVLIRRQRREVLTALLVIGAAVLGASRTVLPNAVATPSWVDAATALKGQIDSAPTTTGRTQSFRLAVTEIEIEDRWQPARGSVCVSASPLPVAGLGDRVLLTGTSRPVDDQAAAVRGYLRSRGCGATVFARSLSIVEPGSGWQRGFADWRNRLSGVLRRAAPGDSGSLLSGLVTGDDHRLTDQRQEAFLRTGTTHITAVSGSNVALVVTILAALGAAGGVRRQFGWQLLVVVAIAAYAVLVGLESPVVRAALVAAGAMLAARFGRRPDMLTLIAMAAALMVWIEPAQIWSLSFQLSFTASLGIVLVMSGLSNATAGAGLQAALSATLAAQVATMPVLWFVIGDISLTTLPANLLIAPLISIAFPLAVLAAGLGLIWEPLATVFVLPARLCTELVFALIDLLGGSPRAVATVGASSALVAMLVSGLAAIAVLAMSPDVRRHVARSRARLLDRSGRSAGAPGVGSDGLE